MRGMLWLSRNIVITEEIRTTLGGCCSYRAPCVVSPMYICEERNIYGATITSILRLAIWVVVLLKSLQSHEDHEMPTDQPGL